MAEPARLHIKRRRTEEAPDVLVLEGTGKDASQVRYVKKQKNQNSKDGEQAPQFLRPHQPIRPAVSSQQRKASRRIFHLQAAPSVTGKRKGTEDRVATFVEKKKSRSEFTGIGSHVAAVPPAEEGNTAEENPISTGTHGASSEMPAAAETYKRPGKGSALAKTQSSVIGTAVSDEDQRQLQQLADYMHHAALEEAERESRPKAVTGPRLSAERAQELHRRRIASNRALEAAKDHDLESDDEYEFDTYILAPASTDLMEIDGDGEPMNVGYLIISEQDQELWETFLDDEANGKEWQSDDEDENAEDYYGADYPEDEVDSDDEFDRHAHGYRAEEEEWDEDTGTYSEDEYDRMMNPFKKDKIPLRLAKYLSPEDSN